MSDRHIRRHTKAELEAKIARGEDRTDWSRVDALSEDEIDDAARRDPDSFVGDTAFWQAAELLYPKAGKERVTLRLDADVLDWFRSAGPGYQTRINAVLRAFMKTRRAGPDPTPAADKPRRRV
jgi:uncharacterized protein (DUF4415 family)